MPDFELPYRKRQQQLIATLKESEFDAVALNASPSQKYFSGLEFHLMERPIVLLIHSNGAMAIVLPEFERGKLEYIDYELNSFSYSEDPSEWQASFVRAFEHLALLDARIGIEDTSLRFLELEYAK